MCRSFISLSYVSVYMWNSLTDKLRVRSDTQVKYSVGTRARAKLSRYKRKKSRSERKRASEIEKKKTVVYSSCRRGLNRAELCRAINVRFRVGTIRALHTRLCCCRIYTQERNREQSESCVSVYLIDVDRWTLRCYVCNASARWEIKTETRVCRKEE